MYQEAYQLCRNTAAVMGFFSEELRELDRNTVQLMIDEMQTELERLKETPVFNTLSCESSGQISKNVRKRKENGAKNRMDRMVRGKRLKEERKEVKAEIQQYQEQLQEQTQQYQEALRRIAELEQKCL